MTNSPVISVIVAVYKTEIYLKECVDSILSQTYANFEIILIDDCSPDNCPQMCDDYAKSDSRIKVIHHEKNQGSIVTYRDGLNCASGEYILFVDSDDWIEPDTIERLQKKANAEKCDIVYCDLIRFTDDGKLTPYVPFDCRGREKSDMILNMINGNLTQFIACRLFRRKLFDNMVWPEYQFREDTVICIQLFLNAEKVGYEYSTLYHYRYNLGSITVKNHRPYLEREEYLNLKKLDEIFSARPDYEIYQPTLNAVLNGKKNYKKKVFIGFNLMRFFRAFVPHGILAIYRRLKEK